MVAQLVLQCNDVCLRDAVVFPRSAPVLTVDAELIFVRPESRNFGNRAGRPIGHFNLIFLIFLIFLINPGPERASRRIAQKRSTALGSGAIPEIPSTMVRSASTHSRRLL